MSERVRNVNSTDTLRTGAAEAGADPDDENRIDFGTLFPAKGDSRRPPEWFGRALLYVALAVIVFMFCWRSWGDISYLVLDIIISLFLALAVEPLVVAPSAWWAWPWSWVCCSRYLATCSYSR